MPVNAGGSFRDQLMRFAIMERLRFLFRPKLGSNIAQDADDLIQIFGDAAYEAAIKMAWREQQGLLVEQQANHWEHVRQEVALLQDRFERQHLSA